MNLLNDIWKSFCSLPLWVRLWMFFLLVPINMLALAFMGEPGGAIIAFLAVAGLAFNAIPMWVDRGFTNAMAVPHVIFWLPLIVFLLFQLFVSEQVLSGSYRTFLLVLLVCNIYSLVWDIPDSVRWFKQRKA